MRVLLTNTKPTTGYSGASGGRYWCQSGQVRQYSLEHCLKVLMKVWPGHTIFIIALLDDIVASLARLDHIHYSIFDIYWCKFGQVRPYLL